MNDSIGGYYFIKCGCGIFVTDYSFIAECLKCGYYFGGSRKDIRRWKKRGKLMEMIDPKTMSAEERTRLIDEYETNRFAEDDYLDDGGEDIEEEESCPEGFSFDECCGCITRFGIETCEFSCPFGGPPKCGEKQAKKCREEMRKQEKKRIKKFEKQKKNQTFEINETLELDPKKDYPFRSSLVKTARCGMCKNSKKQLTVPIQCKKGHYLIGPYITEEHDCKDYKYEAHCIEEIPIDKIHHFMGIEDRYPECNYCSHQFHGYCSGLKWYPITIKNGLCEFFRNKNLTCKHAIPCFQYGETIRNNYCNLDPSKRDQSHYEDSSWKWKCPSAHKENAKYLKCYEPINGGQAE